jgi:CheY-like chemotaxis protein
MTELRTILLAEDSARDVELALEAFEESHLANQVVVVRDGVEALDYLRREGAYANRAAGHPVVVLLDIKMPRIDGLEVLNTMRHDPALQYIPVVMLTSSREEQDLVRSYELGVNAYVVKPVDFPQFIDAVKRVGVFWAVLNELPGEGAHHDDKRSRG